MAEDDLTCESAQVMEEIDAPELPYEPDAPKTYRSPIGLIGCGGITPHHLDAYRTAGYEVVALCDIDEEKVEERQD